LVGCLPPNAKVAPFSKVFLSMDWTLAGWHSDLAHKLLLEVNVYERGSAMSFVFFCFIPQLKARAKGQIATQLSLVILFHHPAL
jgi:hypothetical protein